MKLIDKKLDIVIRLDPETVYKANINSELSINTHDIKGELISQPAKYALWASMSKVAQRKLFKLEARLKDTNIGDERYETLFEEYSQMKQHYELINEVVVALDHRGKTLLSICLGINKAISKYREDLSKLRALQGH